jgi:hypothetical protein
MNDTHRAASSSSTTSIWPMSSGFSTCHDAGSAAPASVQQTHGSSGTPGTGNSVPFVIFSAE